MSKEQFIKRLKSLLWRSTMMGIAEAFVYFPDKTGKLGMPLLLTTLGGLVLAEITKQLNK
ncbi:hypothetical protein LCGC14_2550590 [marine sediment metagenome]|uniref:Uncharacterized protein n=1 Tax=marine sediment metagenome TaxID=412755 RepID=A0A0F9DG33_9ZZZZ